MRNKPNSLNNLQSAGFTYEDACALRRIAMTLHRWHELECGDSNDYASWCITRGHWRTLEAPHSVGVKKRTQREFVHDEEGTPFLERHAHDENKATYEAIPDRERGALKRLAAIMARYPGFASFVQGDPRGASLYILRPADIVDAFPTLTVDPAEFDRWLSANYSRGVAVFK